MTEIVGRMGRAPFTFTPSDDLMEEMCKHISEIEAALKDEAKTSRQNHRLAERFYPGYGERRANAILRAKNRLASLRKDIKPHIQ